MLWEILFSAVNILPVCIDILLDIPAGVNKGIFYKYTIKSRRKYHFDIDENKILFCTYVSKKEWGSGGGAGQTDTKLLIKQQICGLCRGI